MKLENITSKFEKLHAQVSTQKFLEKKGLSGEIPFFICTYNPAQESDVSREINRLYSRLKQEAIHTIVIDLYDLTIRILEKRNLLQKVMQTEQGMDKTKLFNSLQNILDPERHLIPEIESMIDEDATSNGADSKIVMITGVGTVFPYIRSHTILNNLQNAIKDRPMLLFFPGVYDGHQLNLFGKMKDDNYYRAFNIEHYNSEE